MFIEIDVNTRKVTGKPVGGIKPTKGFWLPVVDNSIYPTDPDLFRDTPTYEYLVVVKSWLDEAEVKADWSFDESDYVEQKATQGIKSLEQCKDVVYSKQKTMRQGKQLGSFSLGEVKVTLNDREDSIIISSLSEVATDFKVGKNLWASLSGPEVAALKEAHRSHVQLAYTWEKEENGKVDIMDYEQLKIYLLNIDN